MAFKFSHSDIFELDWYMNYSLKMKCRLLSIVICFGKVCAPESHSLILIEDNDLINRQTTPILINLLKENVLLEKYKKLSSKDRVDGKNPNKFQYVKEKCYKI